LAAILRNIKSDLNSHEQSALLEVFHSFYECGTSTTFFRHSGELVALSFLSATTSPLHPLMPTRLRRRRAFGTAILLVALLLWALAPQVAAAQPLQVTPGEVDFGILKSSTGASRDLVIRNPGTDRLEVRLQIDGDAFRIDSDTLRFAAGAEMRVQIHFSAIDIGAYRGELSLQIKELFGSKKITVPLNAVVDQAEISIKPVAGIDAGEARVGSSVERTVQLSNTGRVEFVIDSLAVVPANIGMSLRDASARRLQPNSSLDLVVGFSPVADGAVRGRLAIYSADLPEGLIDIPIAGEGLAPRLAVSPLAEVGLDFMTMEVGHRERRSLSLLNQGRADLDVDLRIDHEAFTAGVDSVLVIEAGERRDVDILFEPRYEGPASGLVVLRTNDPSRQRIELALTGRARVTPPKVEVLNRTPIIFGGVPIGNPAQEQLLLWNRGGSPYTVRLELEDEMGAEFALETAAVLLQPGESGKVGLTFQPKEIGDREAVLWVETESGRSRIELHGTGKFLKLSPSAHDFGRVPVGEASSGLIDLVNIGNADFTISRVRSTSDDFIPYTQISPDSKFLLPANSLRSLPINVTYEPASRGLSSGTLRLEGFWEEGTETLEILLNGIGVAAEIELYPAGTVDFGFVILGDSTMRTLVATNSGDTSLQVEANALTREALVEPQSFSLEPGESTTLKVFFSPQAFGERFGQILLVSNDVRDKAQPIKIKGQGVLENIDLAQITSVTVSRKDVALPIQVPWNNTPMVLRDGTRIDLRFLLPDSLRQALVGRRIDIEWTELDENYDPKGGGKQTTLQIYEDAGGSLLAEDLNLRLKEAGTKRVRMRLTTHSYPGAPPQSVSQIFEAGGWRWDFEAKPLVSFLTIRPGRDWTDSDGNVVRGETERLIGLPGLAFVGWHNSEHPAVSGIHLTATGNVLEALSTGNSIAISLGLAVSMYKDRFLLGFGWDIYDSRTKAKRKGSQDYIMTFKYSGLF
ncbi:MAG TPA: hypothetical protein DIC52_09145, partial [Candidatus Latescibacteria bacterium]|nr:hypothetical protein [Candidatus Latescibacterota bacterium]